MTTFIGVKKPLFIPYWIKQLLIRNHLPLTAVTELAVLKKACSIEDLVLMLGMNNNLLPILGYASTETCLHECWLKDEESVRIHQQLMDLMPLHTEGLEARLYNEATRDPKLSLPYEILDISSEVFLVVIYPGYFGSAQGPAYQKQLVSDYLKQWYGYNNYDTIAQSQFFERYLKQL